MTRRQPPQLRIITDALTRLIPGAETGSLLVRVTDRGAGGGVVHSWEGSVPGLAQKITAALLGQDRARTEGAAQTASPASTAEVLRWAVAHADPAVRLDGATALAAVTALAERHQHEHP